MIVVAQVHLWKNISIYVFIFRRQELRELRLMQKEANRAQAVLSTKLDTQRDQMHRRFDQEMNVSIGGTEEHPGNNFDMSKV